ncbi:MAG TPA: glycosyltransferase family 4 protein [Anaerolineae bacterium]|nr:glycosyltransferase family 4 protein [Anaerolineae bacterium]
MKILEVLTYYRPHISGLTIYVERLCRSLARHGHQVTVLTSQYEPSLPRHETMDGVDIVRAPVAFRVSKGVIMPTFGFLATKHALEADIIHLHLPQFDAPGLALRGRLLGKPVVITYHSDLRLPDGLFNRVVDYTVSTLNRVAGNLADVVVTYTGDFGRHSPFLSHYAHKKLHIIPPPVELAPCPPETTQFFATKNELAGRKVIGICARLAAEKGVEILLHALPAILDQHPDALVLHAGPYQDILGEEAYAARLAPLFDQYQNHYRLLGPLEGPQLTAFFQNLDCLVLCSLNNTETFGLVQIEAMINGVPSVASNLPGVRQPVTITGMGEIAPIGDAPALAAAVNRVLANPDHYRKDPALIAQSFHPDATAQAYLELFADLKNGRFSPDLAEPAAYQQLRARRDQP